MTSVMIAGKPMNKGMTIMDAESAFPQFLEGNVDAAARQLLGCMFERELDGCTVRVRIVETEAYDQDDEASHAYGGKRTRNAVMFGPAGHLYVYFTYGMHYCCNVVTGQTGRGAGVLIRAVESLPDETDRDVLAILSKNRGGLRGPALTNGPAKLTQALAIGREMNGHDLHRSPLTLAVGNLRLGETIATSPRIGISRARELHRRFFITGNPYVSR